ncbi:MAG: hydroxymethylglutaryl-CoA reductase, degradative [Deltaproteobacteria bacterium]|nr:MAG: hydroxymethylglutaryl-CoA reductase, degradative [Deltaproteobacteria bacterium]
MSSCSRIPGFYRLPPHERLARVKDFARLEAEDIAALEGEGLDLTGADLMIENVIGRFPMPLGVGINFLIDGRDRIVPMVVEEPSVVAAASNMARLVRQAGGFHTEVDRSVMIGQVQVIDVDDPAATAAALRAAIPRLKEATRGLHPLVESLGGGLVDMEVRELRYDEPGQPHEDMVVLHFEFDCVDAMGANMVNTVAEHLAPIVEQITGARVGLRILSNLASRRLARARCAVPAALLDMDDCPGIEVARGIAAAYRFAWADPWRAATHNKGIMNGVDPVVIATGNDWRAVEAGAHAWAARDGKYRSLSRWTVDEEGVLHGELVLPMQVGVVGGTLRNHPTVRAAHRILGNPTAAELSGIIAAVGLAQNMGALRALATEGIQRGHMRLHARSVAVEAGAAPHEVQAVVEVMCAHGDYSLPRARAALDELRAAE